MSSLAILDRKVNIRLEGIINAGCVIVICGSALFPPNVAWHAIVALCGLILSVRTVSRTQVVNALDYIAILLPLALALISFRTSPYACFRDATLDWSMLMSSYVICKTNKNNPVFTKIIMVFLNIFMISLLAWGCVTFAFHIYGLKNAGFNRIYSFRHLYHPFGVTNNAWSEVLVLLFPLAMKQKGVTRVVLLSSLTMMLSLTFSKGAYLSLTMLYGGTLLIVKDKKSRKSILWSLCITTMFDLICCHEAIGSMFETFSQTDSGSNQWRINSIKTIGGDLIGMNLCGFGVGQYNAHEFLSYGLDPKYILSVAPNIIVRLITEYGIVGFGLTFLSFVIALYELWINNEKILFVVFMALLVRELTYSAIHVITIVSVLGIIYLAFAGSSKSRDFKKKNIVGLFCFIATLIWIFPFVNTKKGSGQSSIMRELVLMLESGTNKEYDKDVANHLIRNENVLKGVPYYQVFYLYIFKTPVPEDSLNFGCKGNSYWQFLYGRYLYDQNLKESAYGYLLNSLISNPSLIKTSEFSTLNKKSGDCLRQKLVSYIKMVADDGADIPADRLAKLGVALCYLKDSSGIALLNKALREYPSLVVPWKLTGELRKYNYLKYGRCDMAYEDAELYSFKEMLIKEYRDAFIILYGESIPQKYSLKLHGF